MFFGGKLPDESNFYLPAQWMGEQKNEILWESDL